MEKKRFSHKQIVAMLKDGVEDAESVNRVGLKRNLNDCANGSREDA